MSDPDFTIVGMGASAGGIDAFRVFFANLPPTCGMAFVMILHLPADRRSMLIEVLSRWTSMPVVEAVQGARIEPDHVYVPPPHSVVTVANGMFGVQLPEQPGDRLSRPIDGFFDSMASALRERAVGIVLSGTGSDGALGLKAIKECGGLTIAQGSNGTSPEYGEMPAGAIATGSVDIIAPVEDIPGHLLRVKNAHVNLAASGDQDSDADQARNVDRARTEICAILRAQLDHDFSDYRSQTFLRRVERRMQVLGVANIDGYVAALKSDPNEVKHLFRDLLIRVTSFFRDKDTFEALETQVIPKLFDGKMADGTVRVWVPGCATGEEAYSLAILLRERMAALHAVPKVQVFATDIDESAISTARLGRYPRTLLDGLSEQRLRRFFTFSNGGYCVAKEIRDLCTFSVHSLIRDPPFSAMSLVSCRNLLIYLNPKLQARIVPLFHYSLVPHGILLLGGSESLSQHADLFDTLDKSARIFQRRPGRSPELNLRWQRSHSNPSAQHTAEGAMTDPNQKSPGAKRNSSGLGPTDGAAVKAPDMQFQDLLGPVIPNEQTVGRLQKALADAAEEHRSLTEEHQTALEELRSANEELHSVNEEMQSTNEELETSKEELQSLNEELHTVNIRLSEKIDELDKSSSDLRNVFDSTEIATVFLDRHLVIRSFTAAIAALYNLIPSDQGRPLTDIVSRLQYSSLREDVAFVLSTLEPLERRVVRTDHAAHYMMRILPYRDTNSTVSGVLVTFVDVTNIVKAEEALVAADSRKDVFLATLSHELRNPLAPIRIAAQLLQSPRLEEGELKHAQAIIARQVVHMSSLLDDLLDVSRITRGSFLLKKEYVDVQLLIDDAVEAVRPAMDSKKHTLRVEYPPTPLRLEVDAVRITQVITNLLTNAARYTPRGGLISLATRMDSQHFVIFVRDNGVGLSPESMGKVFDMFTRIDSEPGRSEGGLGIGLALAKGLMELHGGTIKVNSGGRGEGSEFLICIPRSLVVETPPPVADSSQDTVSPIIARRILVADDNRDSADSLSMLLKLSGHEVHVANSGAEALEAANRVRPDVGVFDIGMPDITGYEVAERIRHEAWGERMTLIAVTGWGQESDKKRALAAGFDHHLTKPIDPSKLETLLQA